MADESSSDDKTEEPTARKLEKAIESGDVPRSMEINTWFILGALTLMLLVLATSSARQMTLDMKRFLMNMHQVPADAAGISMAGQRAMVETFSALAMPFLLFIIAAIVGGGIQNRPLWTFKPLSPQVSRISPLAGFKRLFGAEAMVQFIKGLVKLLIVGIACGYILWKEHDRLEGMAQLDAAAILPVLLSLTLKLMVGVLSIFTLIALGDLVYQRMSWMKRQRMTKQEIKEEYKQSDGNPEIKAKIRQLRSQRARKRMMAAVPQANVIITNPTHFAVALKYEQGMPAPICVAKGADLIALKIRSIAEDNRIPIVENPPLARALHASVEIDEEIPVEHYKAVAEVIGYVLRLKRRPALG
jgi:flagellar biosynthesis protein FlhB